MHQQNDTGLIVVDVQGKLAQLVHDSASIIGHCEILIESAKLLHLPVIWLEQNPEKLGHTVSPLKSKLTHLAPIPKYTFNACNSPAFIEAINAYQKKHWLICGIEAHICVYQTASALAGKGLEVDVVSDCIASRTQQNKQIALNRLAQKGIGITGLEMCLYELLEDSRHPAFKTILSLIK